MLLCQLFLWLTLSLSNSFFDYLFPSLISPLNLSPKLPLLGEHEWAWVGGGRNHGKSLRFGDRFCMEKHRLSCIFYLSKTHFVPDFLQNSIGNSSGRTNCNPKCLAGTINALTNSCFNSPFPWRTLSLLNLSLTSLYNLTNFVSDKIFPWLTVSLTNSFFD